MSYYGDRAEALSWEGFVCGQCVVGAVCERFGIDRISAMRMAAAFGSGQGGNGLTCGTVTGALMLIGLKYGRIHPDDPEETGDACFELAQKFQERFKEKYDGALNCRDLLGADCSTQEGMKFIMEQNLWNTRCKKIVRDAAEIVAELLGLTEGER